MEENTGNQATITLRTAKQLLLKKGSGSVIAFAITVVSFALKTSNMQSMFRK
jgi:hypothetical protein